MKPKLATTNIADAKKEQERKAKIDAMHNSLEILKKFKEADIDIKYSVLCTFCYLPKTDEFFATYSGDSLTMVGCLSLVKKLGLDSKYEMIVEDSNE